MSQNPIFIFNKIIAAKYIVMQCIAMSRVHEKGNFMKIGFVQGNGYCVGSLGNS